MLTSLPIETTFMQRKHAALVVEVSFQKEILIDHHIAVNIIIVMMIPHLLEVKELEVESQLSGFLLC